MAITRLTPIALLASGALALPGTAVASSISASAVAHASAQANASLRHAARLAVHSHRLSPHARAILRRSRRELRRAADQAVAATASAQSAAQVQAAAQADAAVSQALMQNAKLLAQITLHTSASVQSQAAEDLLADVQMQSAALRATIRMAADQVGAQAREALHAACVEVSATSLEVRTASTLAASSNVNGSAQASADLAVATGTDAIADAAATASKLAATVQADGQAQWAQLEQMLSDAASQIQVAVTDSGTAQDTVTVDGRGPTTLGTLAQASVNATSSSSVGYGGGTASAQTSIQGGVGSA